MPQFWMGTYTLNNPAPATGSMAEPLLSGNISVLAIEVICDQARNEYTVFISSADVANNPGVLECRVAFSNAASQCNIWRDRGFPLIDAKIEYDAPKKSLTVTTLCFDKEPAMKYAFELMNITGIEFSANAASTVVFKPAYRQNEQSPDFAWPATWVCRKQVTWEPSRANVKHAPGSVLTFTVQSPRTPNLTPLANAPYVTVDAWSGDVTLPQTRNPGSAPTQRVNRVDTFGVPAFQFGEVEVLGFRIDLPHTEEVEQGLEHLIAPLNFHLAHDPGSDFPDFRYRTTSYSLLLEVLRYGTMRLATQDAPLTKDDYQSQHELLVRILVARVDDDASQARDPAVFVPAIFVDNPWSKVLGRDVQGFDKCLADFCVLETGNPVRLRPDGVDVKVNALGKVVETPRRLSDIAEVRLVDRTDGDRLSKGPKLLEIDCTPGNYDNWDEFEEVGIGSALPLLSLADVRWRPSDFERLEYTGSFMRTAISQLLRGFRSVQSAPVGAQEVEKAWITGKFTVKDVVAMSFPMGTASLTFHAPQDAPEGWKKVCALLAEWPRHDLHMGSWYRSKFSMNMTIDDGLEWND